MTAADADPITWHLDPTVWQRAVHGGYEALLWWTGPGSRLGWCLYRVGGLDTIDQGHGAGEADAKAQAEAALRRAMAAVGQHDSEACRDGDHYGQCSGATLERPLTR